MKNNNTNKIPVCSFLGKSVAILRKLENKV